MYKRHTFKIKSIPCIYTYISIYVYMYIYTYIYTFEYIYMFVFICKNTHFRIYQHIIKHVLNLDINMYKIPIHMYIYLCAQHICKYMYISFEINVRTYVHIYVFITYALLDEFVFYVGHGDKSSLYETLFHCNILSKHHHNHHIYIPCPSSSPLTEPAKLPLFVKGDLMMMVRG
jgi:hypothetical protein